MTQAFNLSQFANFVNSSGQASSSAFQAGLLIPSGIITMWSGSIATIPVGWNLCDGSSGTPDLRSKFLVGASSAGGYAVGATGGTADAVVVSHNHTVTDPGHTHATVPSVAYVGTVQGGHAGGGAANPDGYPQLSLATATTGISIANAGVSGTNANLPPYYALAYIMKL